MVISSESGLRTFDGFWKNKNDIVVHTLCGLYFANTTIALKSYIHNISIDISYATTVFSLIYLTWFLRNPSVCVLSM